MTPNARTDPPKGLAVGDDAVIAGNFDGWGVPFPPGTPVRLKRFDPTDSSWFVETADGQSGWVGLRDVGPDVSSQKEIEEAIASIKASHEQRGVGVVVNDFVTLLEDMTTEAEQEQKAVDRRFLVLQDGSTWTTRCPFCEAIGTICEVERSVRWNKLGIIAVDDDGAITCASTRGDDLWDSDDYTCTACHAELNEPDNFEITDWF